MAAKLNPGDTFPTLALSTSAGETLTLPDDVETAYAIVLFYRGHWWPFCRRLLAGYDALREEFADLGVSIFAGTVDSREQTAAVAEHLGYPVAYGVSRDQGDAIGAWWEERRDHIQPSEFILTGKGRVLGSVYSNTPVGRMDPAETLALMKLIAR